MRNKNNKVEKEIHGIIKAYDHLVLGVEKKAKAGVEGRAYGGIIRAGKGELVVSIAKEILMIAWDLLGGDRRRIIFPTHGVKVPIKKDYIDRIKDSRIKKYISDNISKFYYLQNTDLPVYIDDKFVIGIECKAYTENAMMKRILVDFTLLKEVHPKLDCVLLQLESQLGGDFSELDGLKLGSFPTHTLLSFFDVDLIIITLLRGERKVDQPIHKPGYYKPLTKESLYKAIEIFKRILEKYK
jgi:hypothetical protein